jgi:hypothetical protein
LTAFQERCQSAAPGRRSITLKLSSEEAERKAKYPARTEQDKLQ